MDLVITIKKEVADIDEASELLTKFKETVKPFEPYQEWAQIVHSFPSQV